MEHRTKIIEKQKQHDGSIAFRCRCCDDPTTDSWHTIQFAHHAEVAKALNENPLNHGVKFAAPEDATREFVKAELEAHKARVQQMHELNQTVDALGEEFVDASD